MCTSFSAQEECSTELRGRHLASLAQKATQQTVIAKNQGSCLAYNGYKNTPQKLKWHAWEQSVFILSATRRMLPTLPCLQGIKRSC
mmetsp:Transcript_1367/g.3274  ORF Transcript_1367/g.3274 Transcript_1367/m.3274 type:complete len:86 (+) Transcript_1367:317-574(+)